MSFLALRVWNDTYKVGNAKCVTYKSLEIPDFFQYGLGLIQVVY